MPRRGSFATSLLLTGVLVVLAGFGGDWGRAYGQTAGPTPTPNQAVLNVTKEATTSTAAPGDPVVYIIRITNSGSQPARDVEAVDTMPGSLEPVNAYATKGSVSTSGQTVTTTVPELAPGETVILTAETRIRNGAQGQIANQVVVRAVNVAGAAGTEARAEAVLGVVDQAPGGGSAANSGDGGAGADAADTDDDLRSQLSNTGAHDSMRWLLLALGVGLSGVGGAIVVRNRKTS